MKKVLFSLIISSALLLLVGCQENSATNPVSSESLNKADLTHETTLRGTILLDQKLADPVIRDNSDFLVKGNINYIESVFSRSGPQVTPLINADAFGVDVTLDISVDAILKSVNSSTVEPDNWKISSVSKDQVFVTKNGSPVLVKSYPVLGRTDKLELVCTFTVTANGLRLDSVILDSPIM